jgi:hypothetical protein
VASAAPVRCVPLCIRRGCTRRQACVEKVCVMYLFAIATRLPLLQSGAFIA